VQIFQPEQMKLYLKVLLFGAFNFLVFSSKSQVPYLKQYSVSEGLLTNEIYQVYQDYQGYIWLATSTGVCKFDGKHFIPVDNPKEFRNASIHEIREDSKKQLWFVSLTGNLFYGKSSKVVPFVYNPAIQDKLYTNKGHIRNSFIPLSDSSVVISLKERGAIIVRRNGIVTFKYPNQKSGVIVDFSKNSPFISFQYNRSRLVFNVEVVDSKNASLLFDLKISPTHLYAAKLRNGNKVFSLDKIVYVVGKGWFKKYEMDDAVTGIYEDKDSRLWISVNGHGVSCYSDENLTSSLVYRILEKETVTSVLQDKEGSFWFSTINSGVLFTPSL
jgi:ligand-binding sensor domain-containing protein